MTAEERELLLRVATVLFGSPTGADFQSVAEALIAARQLTQDLYHLTEGATLLKTSEFTRALVTAIREAREPNG
jgi:hypothetical protein